MALTHGRDSCIGAGEESSYGTAAAITVWTPLISSSLRRKVNRVPRPHLVSSNAAYRSHFDKEDIVEGDLEMEMLYEGSGIWLKHLLGSLSTSGPAGSIYTHTYRIAADLPTGLTLEQALGRPISGTRRSEIFEGIKLASGRIRINVGDVGRLSLSCIGETTQTMANISTTPTFSTNDVPLKFNQSGSLSFNSVTYAQVKSLEYTIENSIDRRMMLGALTTKEPKRSGFVVAKLRAVLEYEDENLLNAHLADTQGDVAITFTGTSSRTFGFTLHNGFLTDYGNPIQGPGIIERTVEWTSESDGTDDGIAIVVANTQSSGVAA
jgi:hypothetical protein